MRAASAGRMSSMYSGRTQVRMSGVGIRDSGVNYSLEISGFFALSRIPHLASRVHFGASLTRYVEQQQSCQHRSEPDEADLSVAHLGQSPEGVAPQRRHQERQQPLDDEHQRERGEQDVSHRRLRSKDDAAPSGCGALQGRLAAAGLEVLEELRIGLEYEDIAPAAEARFVGFEAAVEGVELGILLVGLGVDGRRLAIAFALDALRLAVGLRDDHFALLVRFRADAL